MPTQRKRCLRYILALKLHWVHTGRFLWHRKLVSRSRVSHFRAIPIVLLPNILRKKRTMFPNAFDMDSLSNEESRRRFRFTVPEIRELVALLHIQHSTHALYTCIKHMHHTPHTLYTILYIIHMLFTFLGQGDSDAEPRERERMPPQSRRKSPTQRGSRLPQSLFSFSPKTMRQKTMRQKTIKCYQIPCNIIRNNIPAAAGPS